MAMSNYSYNPNKPAFATMDNDDASAFLSSSGAPYLAADKLPMSSEERALQEAENRRETMLQQMRRVQQSTLDSSKRSVGLLVDSEKMGVETAQDLSQQREQLENADQRLDELNSNLKDTQKNINGIKSVLSSLRQWWSAPKNGKHKEATVKESSEKSPPKMSSHLSSAVEKCQSSTSPFEDNHPALRLRGIDEEESEVIPKNYNEFQEHSRRVDNQLDENLDTMSAGLTRLKGLATGLGSEIESQNELLDRIQNKADSADITVISQNKQMNKILKR